MKQGLFYLGCDIKEKTSMRYIKDYLKKRNPEVTIFSGYVFYIIIGVMFLSIPFFRTNTVSFLDNLFITVSAISTTGLATVSVSDNYNFLGQLVILILIQLGGIGYMTFGSFIILSTKNHISTSREQVHKAAFSLPKEFKIGKFIRSVVIYTLIVEFIGACLLFLFFIDQPQINPFWNSIFHSVSAFCTAGFSLYNTSFEAFSSNWFFNIVIFTLSFLGAIGYIVMVDVWLVLKGKKESITFTSKIILSTTIILLALGTFFLFFDYLKIDNSDLDTSLLKSFFQTMTALTTVGFNTVPINGLKSSSLFIITLLMIIGASPSGTGGGIKSTTLSTLFGVIRSVFSNKKEYICYNYKPQQVQQQDKSSKNILSLFKSKKEQPTTNEEFIQYSEDLNSIFGEVFKIKLMGRTIPFNRVIHAIANFIFYFFILFIGILLLLSIEHFTFEQIFFESASALGTVGLSTGITSSLSHYGKIIVIILMFIGRIGPISFGIILLSRKKSKEQKEYEDIVI